MQKRRPARGRLRSRHDAREVSRSRLVHPQDDFMEVMKRIYDEFNQAIENLDQGIEMLGQAIEILVDVDTIVDR